MVLDYSTNNEAHSIVTKSDAFADIAYGITLSEIVAGVLLSYPCPSLITDAF